MDTYYCFKGEKKIATFEPIRNNNQCTLKKIPTEEHWVAKYLQQYDEYFSNGVQKTPRQEYEVIDKSCVIARAFEQYKYWYESQQNQSKKDTLYKLISKHRLDSVSRIDLLLEQKDQEILNTITSLYNNKIKSIKKQNKLSFTPTIANQNYNIIPGLMDIANGVGLLICCILILASMPVSLPILHLMDNEQRRQENEDFLNSIKSDVEDISQNIEMSVIESQSITPSNL